LGDPEIEYNVVVGGGDFFGYGTIPFHLIAAWYGNYHRHFLIMGEVITK